MSDAVTVWCKSLTHPIRAGVYMLDGQQVRVVQSRSGRFYAVSANGKYVPGLIYKLRASLESGPVVVCSERSSESHNESNRTCP